MPRCGALFFIAAARCACRSYPPCSLALDDGRLAQPHGDGKERALSLFCLAPPSGLCISAGVPYLSAAERPRPPYRTMQPDRARPGVYYVFLPKDGKTVRTHTYVLRLYFVAVFPVQFSQRTDCYCRTYKRLDRTRSGVLPAEHGRSHPGRAGRGRRCPGRQGRPPCTGAREVCFGSSCSICRPMPHARAQHPQNVLERAYIHSSQVSRRILYQLPTSDSPAVQLNSSCQNDRFDHPVEFISVSSFKDVTSSAEEGRRRPTPLLPYVSRRGAPVPLSRSKFCKTP